MKKVLLAVLLQLTVSPAFADLKCGDLQQFPSGGVMGGVPGNITIVESGGAPSIVQFDYELSGVEKRWAFPLSRMNSDQYGTGDTNELVFNAFVYDVSRKQIAFGFPQTEAFADCR